MARTALLLLATALASAGTPEEAVRAFRRAYESKDPTVRRKAVALLEEVSHPSATEALLPALSDEDGRVRERAREILLGRAADADLDVIARAGLRAPSPEVRRRCADALALAAARAAPHATSLEATLRDRDSVVREAAAAALGAAGHRGSAPVVAAALRREAAPEVRGALLLALDRLAPDEAAAEARRIPGRERDGPPAVAALRVLGLRDPPGAARAGAVLLEHPAWEARSEAAAALAAHGSGGADVEALIRALGREKRMRVREAIGAALERLTGAPFGEDLDRWNRWWKEKREGWTPRTAPTAEARPPGDGDTVARFYDIPIDGDRVVFVLDTSKSMLDPARLGEKATKMEVAISHFAKTLADIRPGVGINVVAFGTEVDAWRPRCAEAGPSSKYEALRFMQKHPLEGRTNIFDGLALAMSDREVDSVFLMTDGAPTAGEETTRTGILRGLAHLRRWRPVRIHCVEVGAGNTGSRWKGFLAEVAAAAGGKFASK